MMNTETLRLLGAALEASVYIAPTDYGLSYEELVQVGSRMGLGAGEIGDSLQHVTTGFVGDPRLRPGPSTVARFHMMMPEKPEFKNYKAIAFLHSQLREKAKAEGIASASIDRSVIVERAVAAGIPRNDIEAATTISVLGEHVRADKNLIKIAGINANYNPPSRAMQPIQRSDLERAYPFVKDVIDRRTAGRPAQAEPFDAFAETLTKLGYGMFRMWWAQIVGELRRFDPSSTPVAALNHSASLVETSLTLVVKHARSLDIGVFGSKDFDREPHNWSIVDLVNGAARGGPEAILDDRLKNSVNHLIKTRQRIHAGRLIADYPTGPIPDLRPEEARAGSQTAEQVVRAILDWLHRHPVS
jgi:hypothetical protein